MRKIILICDRCGKQYIPWNIGKGKELYGIAEIDYSDFEPMLDMKMDLCESCYLSLEKWWKDPDCQRFCDYLNKKYREEDKDDN